MSGDKPRARDGDQPVIACDLVSDCDCEQASYSALTDGREHWGCIERCAVCELRIALQQLGLPWLWALIRPPQAPRTSCLGDMPG